MKPNLTIATWVLAGLLSVTVLLLAFAPFSEGINVHDGSRFQSTFFQCGGMPGVTGQFVNDVFYHLGGTGAMDLDKTIQIRGFINAAFYLIGTMALLVAAQHLSLRYGLPIATSFFAMFTYLTIIGIRGVVEGWFKLPGWSLLAAGTLFSGAFLWLKLVELLRNKSWGQRLPLRYGLPITASFFALFTYLTTVCIIAVGDMLLTWSLLAASALLSGGFFGLRIVELRRVKKWD